MYISASSHRGGCMIYIYVQLEPRGGWHWHKVDQLTTALHKKQNMIRVIHHTLYPKSWPVTDHKAIIVVRTTRLVVSIKWEVGFLSCVDQCKSLINRNNPSHVFPKTYRRALSRTKHEMKYSHEAMFKTVCTECYLLVSPLIAGIWKWCLVFQISLPDSIQRYLICTFSAVKTRHKITSQFIWLVNKIEQ